MDASSFPFMLVHSDVWGPAPVGSRCGYSYYVTFRLLMISLVVLGFFYLKEEHALVQGFSRQINLMHP